MSTTWILIGNAARARLYENTGIGKGLRLLSEFLHPQSRMKGVDLVAERAGSTQGVGNGHASRQTATDPKQNEAEHFALEIARSLEHGRGQNKYARLILVVGSPFLGILKARLPDKVLGLMSDTLDKDYTAVNEREISKHLAHCIYL
jgi:protein required for attachment to host cells